jgi:hypothetical protein
MKKCYFLRSLGLVVVCMLCLPSQYLKAQSASETLHYLNTNYQSFPAEGSCPNSIVDYRTTNDLSVSSILCKRCIKCTASECTEWEQQSILTLQSVRSISYHYQKYGRLADNSERPECWIFEVKGNISDENDRITIYIDPHKSMAYLEGFKKALTHLALLAGATIINDKPFE